ncbi:MAG TPA: hypothetical protein VHB27_17915 [Rhodopila sp.]|uniref:hypothetical protein n=1 Tax=Rhodopila sp. TaxID=2480087 RepID=UPI002BCB7BC3|nr:hypothetical protein [Rhodopila sp.]HVY17105.1 hypothetical protein [Rhodopila sp.]
MQLSRAPLTEHHLRGDANQRRLIYIGPLTPRAGVADVFEILAAWADDRPYVHIEITWYGDGALKGILQAQPLPANMHQMFKNPATDVGPDFSCYDLCVMPSDQQSLKEWGASLKGLKGLSITDDNLTELLLAAKDQVEVWACSPSRGTDLVRLLDCIPRRTVTT